MSLGEFIKQKRKEKNISSRELARRSSVSQPYISQLENNKDINPTNDMLKKLANGLGISYIELLQNAGYIEEAEKETLANAARKAAEINKNTDDKLINSKQIINPEKFPDPNTIRKKVNVPIEYTVNGELREFENNDLFDLYYLIFLGMDNNDIINLTFKGKPIDKEKLSKVLDAIRLILE